MKKLLFIQKKDWFRTFFSYRVCAIVIMIVLPVFTAVQAGFGQVVKNTNGTPGGKQNWAVSPFEQKVFIENRGQFDGKNGLKGSFSAGTIKFANANQGIEIYFTSAGLTYKYNEYKELNEEEIINESKEASTGAADNERAPGKTISHFVQMNWMGANPDAAIVAGDAISDYYTYPDLNDKSGKSCIQSNAYKKITYKNIYPLIDVEYSFPENKPGIKYSLILHPGADASAIKMHYSQMTDPAETESDIAEGMSLDSEGNIRIETPFGDIVDHAPLSFYENSVKIKSNFELSGQTVSFKLDKQTASPGQTIIIDPWTTNPAFPLYNAAYDVDYDLAGNIYVYGGGSPWKEIKFSSAGKKIWTYSATLFNAAWCLNGACYGDFAVDGKSGSSYIAEAWNAHSAVRVIKLNSAGTQLGVNPGVANLEEMWRIKYDNCNGQVIIAGGCTQPTYQAAVLDTGMVNITPVKILAATQGYHDFALLTIDNSGNCFMATANDAIDTAFDNVLLKCSANTLLPVSYMASDSCAFLEVASVGYIYNVKSQANGFNGIAADSRYVYTYNGSVLRKWDKNTGTVLKKDSISNTPFQWGGLEVNDCGDVFVGVRSFVLHLDTGLTVIDTIPLFNNVYDLKLGQGNILYATGLGFVSITYLTATSCNKIAVSSTADSCGSHGTATATPLGGNGPFTYNWSNGQTTQTATGLSAGTYTVTVNDNGFAACSNAGAGSATTTVAVPSGGSLIASAGPDTTVCSGASVQLNCLPPGSAYVWSSPYGGLSDTTIADPIAIPLITTTYTVTLTSLGCTGTATVTINIFPSTSTPQLTETKTSPDTIYCSYDPAFITHQWYYNGTLLPGQTGLSYIATESGNYNMAVTDTNGCQISAGINIIINGLHNLSTGNFISIYPNPAADQLTIRAASLHANEPILVSIIDVLGKIIQQEKMYWGNKEDVNIKSLASGIYFLQLQQPEGGKWVGRFVKE